MFANNENSFRFERFEAVDDDEVFIGSTNHHPGDLVRPPKVVIHHPSPRPRSTGFTSTQDFRQKLGLSPRKMKKINYSNNRYFLILTLLTLSTEHRGRWHQLRYK
jgi:hypothetical protein